MNKEQIFKQQSHTLGELASNERRQLAKCGKPICDIRELPLFAGLNDTVIDPIQARASVALFDTGEAIVTRGDPDTGVWFLIQGEARKQRYTETGSVVGIGIVKRGEFFGDEFDGVTVAYDVIATKPCIVMKLPNDAFEMACGNSIILARVCDKMAKGLRRAYDRMERTTAGERIENVLREYEGPMIIRKQDDLAHLAGVTREETCRTIGRMIRSGLLKRTLLGGLGSRLELLSR